MNSHWKRCRRCNFGKSAVYCRSYDIRSFKITSVFPSRKRMLCAFWSAQRRQDHCLLTIIKMIACLQLYTILLSPTEQLYLVPYSALSNGKHYIFRLSGMTLHLMLIDESVKDWGMILIAECTLFLFKVPILHALLSKLWNLKTGDLQCLNVWSNLVCYMI